MSIKKPNRSFEPTLWVGDTTRTILVRVDISTVVDSSLIGAVATVSNPHSASRSPGQSRVAFLLSTLGRLLSLPLISIIVSALSKLTRQQLRRAGNWKRPSNRSNQSRKSVASHSFYLPSADEVIKARNERLHLHLCADRTRRTYLCSCNMPLFSAH